MSDAPPSDAFPDLCSADDHSHSGRQQQLSNPLQSVTPVRVSLYGSCLAHHLIMQKTGHTNGGHDFHGQLLFEYHVVPITATHEGPFYSGHVEFPGQLQSEFNVPFSSPSQDATRNGLPRIDTKAALPQLSIVSDSSTTPAGSMMPQTPHSWADGRLHVHAPLGTLLSPSNIQSHAFSHLVCLDEPIILITDNLCVRSRRACLSPQCHLIRPPP